jgi:GT2 family glycosyltransferase
LATGDILIFLDGDTLADPTFVAEHLAVHRGSPERMVRGDTLHVRSTRLFLDPETGVPWPHESERVARLPEQERTRSLVTREQIKRDFAAIRSRAQRGVYPGFGPRKLQELEMQALHEVPDCAVLWAAAAGSNFSLPRAAFLEAGGFHVELTINEHRELALRLQNRGLRLLPTTARSYHLIHRTGWRDPLEQRDWERIFYAAHPLPAVALMAFLWESISDKPTIPVSARLNSLPKLAAAAERYAGIIGCQAVRDAHLAATATT